MSKIEAEGRFFEPTEVVVSGMRWRQGGSSSSKGTRTARPVDQQQLALVAHMQVM